MTAPSALHPAAPDGVYDAVVVGAGMVGLATVLALAGQGRRVAVAEQALPQRQRGALGWDLRSVALSPPAVAFLASLDDGDVPQMAPIDAMHVWEHDGTATLDFKRQPKEPLAWVVENSAVTTRLWALASRQATVIAPAQVTALAEGADAAELTLADAEGAAKGVLRARLVVAADGAESRLRHLAGAGVRQEPVASSGTQHVIATVARLREPHRGTAWQRFGPTAPAALLPLPGERDVAVIWSGIPPRQTERLALPTDAFRQALQDELEGVAGGIEAVDKRLGFNVRQTLATDINPMPRLVLAGDAVRTLHPLAGQGVNLGLEDAHAIAETAAASGKDLGAHGLWHGYARSRRVRSKAMLGLMRALLAAYGCTRASEGPWWRLARNTALRTINASPAAKAQLIREAVARGPLGSWQDATHAA